MAGIAGSAGSAVIFLQAGGYYTFPKVVFGLAMFSAVGGFAGLGIVSKQFNVTGGTVGQPSTETALHAANQAVSAVNPPAEKE